MRDKLPTPLPTNIDAEIPVRVQLARDPRHHRAVGVGLGSVQGREETVSEGDQVSQQRLGLSLLQSVEIDAFDGSPGEQRRMPRPI